MSTTPSQKEIGARIAQLRKIRDLSQEELARLLNIPRPSLAQVELGKRNLSVTELIRLSEALRISCDKLLAKDFKAIEETDFPGKAGPDRAEIRISVPVMNAEKFKNVLLYILEKTAGKPNVGETVLYKLLYFCDFNHYELHESHLTGAVYKKLPFGPVPRKLDWILLKMEEGKEIQRIKTDYHGYPQTRYLPLVKPDLSKINGAEKQIIDQVIDRFSDWSASAISEYSHGDMPWRATAEGEIIDYELAFYRESPYRVRPFEDETERP